MNSSFFIFSLKAYAVLLVFVLFICLFFYPIFISESTFKNSNYPQEDFLLSSYGWLWPIPGYYRITSPFGKRVSPTSGASTYHSGIDIGAPEGSNLFAACDGEITFTGFLGAGGYTITLTTNNIKITYCHVSPIYIVKEGDFVFQGQLIGNVGPKYVYNVPGNQYHDENGRQTNGATTGTHLHLGIRVDEKYMDPLQFFYKKED